MTYSTHLKGFFFFIAECEGAQNVKIFDCNECLSFSRFDAIPFKTEYNNN